ncbi:outer membrane beta-barrel protein [bacterium]|nr:outer membrane beta-barrel protein [bacterium]
MKKIIASTGMVALGVLGVQAAYTPGMSGQDTAKSWSLHGALRGFYDSNSTTSPSGSEVKSYGLGVEAGVGYNLPLDTTFLGADYTYGLKWYEGRDTGKTDQTHKFNLKLDHSFSERYKVTLKDSFVVTSEPTVLDQGGVVTSPRRLNSDALRNRANLDFAAQFTPKLGATIGYGNTFYDYDQSASDVANSVTGPSRSQLLDRMEHLIPVEGRYTVNPETVALVGYQFGLVKYQDNNPYNVGLPGAADPLNPDWRDNRTHYIYAGIEHNFTPQLNAALRGGVQIQEYTQLPASAAVDDTSTSPYVDGNVSYLYNPGSYVLVGYRHSNSATDLTVLDAQTDLIYVSWTHRITTQLSANLSYQWQYSSFNQGFSGALDNRNEMFNIFGINLSYSINQFLSCEIGYNYDDLDSDVAGRSYTRHVGYIGVRATY